MSDVTLPMSDVTLPMSDVTLPVSYKTAPDVNSLPHTAAVTPPHGGSPGIVVHHIIGATVDEFRMLMDQ